MLIQAIGEIQMAGDVCGAGTSSYQLSLLFSLEKYIPSIALIFKRVINYYI